MHTTRLVLTVAALCCAAAGAQAASPQLTRVLPRGAQRGTEVELTFDGQRLADAQEVLIYEPGITLSKPEQPADKKLEGKQVKVTAKIAPDARLGEYHLRLRTATGLSELRTFWVGALPVVQEKEPNSDARTPQAIPMNVEDLSATLYHQIGIDHEKRLIAPGNRPIDIVRGGRVVNEILA